MGHCTPLFFVISVEAGVHLQVTLLSTMLANVVNGNAVTAKNAANNYHNNMKATALRVLPYSYVM